MWYGKGKLPGGSFKQGFLLDCVRNGGGYREKRDFFSVHWEIQENYPHVVRLHVEAPTATVDPALNALKHEVIQALLAAEHEICAAVKRAGWKYARGRCINAARKNKSTEVFHAVIEGSKERPDELIKRVHQAVGPPVQRLLDRLELELSALSPGRGWSKRAIRRGNISDAGSPVGAGEP